MTDAEFMAEYVAQKKQLVSDLAEMGTHYSLTRNAELEALEALATIPDKLDEAVDLIPSGWSHVEDIRIQIEEALRAFRTEMEGKC